MFLDVDDYIDKKLLNNLQFYIDQDIEMIKFKLNEDGPVFDVVDGQTAFNKLCFEDKYLDSPCLYVIKKELFKRTKLKFEKNVYHEDFGLIPSLIVNAKSFVATDYCGYHYSQTDDSIIRTNDYEKEIKKVNDKYNCSV